MLRDLFGVWWHARVLYSDCVEWFETVDDSKADASFLDDGEPSRLVRGIRWFIDTCVDFSLNDSTHLVVYSRWDRHIAEHPWLVFDNGHDYWWKELFAKSSSLGIVRSDAFVLDTHEMVHKFSFGW